MVNPRRGGYHPLVTGAFGELLRAWRSERGLSQLALSVRTGVSSRHLSFLETARASPSREMVLGLAQALDIPLRDRNALLHAAGFAPIFGETPLDAPALGPIRDALQVFLGATEPNPTFVVNRRYDILDANDAGRWLLATFTEDLGRFGRPHNFARLLLSPAGLRPHVGNWAEVARKVLGRIRREVGGAHARDAADTALLDEIAPALEEIGEIGETPTASPPLVVGVTLRRGPLGLRTFTTIATLGTPLDVTLQELRIETMFPADAESRAVLAGRGRV